MTRVGLMGGALCVLAWVAGCDCGGGGGTGTTDGGGGGSDAGVRDSGMPPRDTGPTDTGQPDGGPMLRGPGEACTATPECESALVCSDGVCCDTDCDGECRDCNAAGSDGTCVDAPAGTQTCGMGECQAVAAACAAGEPVVCMPLTPGT